MSKDAWEAFAEYIEELMEAEHIPGAAVAVSQDGRIIYQQGFGVRDLSTGVPVTPDTVFGTASVSKSFTALVVTQLADEGLLDIDAAVIDYLPEFQLKGVKDMASIKIKHLLSHTTGLPPIGRREDILTFAEHLEYLAASDWEMLGKPGKYFSYSNDMFLLLGAVIERLTGRLYRRVMTARILEAIGMHRSTYSIEELEKFHNVSVPYVYNTEKRSFDKQDWPALGTYEVGGGVRSTVLDLMKYGEVYVEEGLQNGRRVVSASGIRRMREPRYQVCHHEFYGFGLSIIPGYAGVTIVGHGGGQPGVSSHFGFIPEKNLVAAVLTNISGAPADRIWLALVNTALDLPLTKQWAESRPCRDLSTEEIDRFKGIYASEEGDEIKLFAEDGVFKVEIPSGTFAVKAVSSSELKLTGKLSGRTIRFYLSEDGQPWAAFWGYRMLRKK